MAEPTTRDRQRGGSGSVEPGGARVTKRAGTSRARDATADQRSQPALDATPALTSALGRIAAFHADLARVHHGLAAAYDDLASNAENGLAVLADQSVHALVPPVPDQPALLTPAQTAEALQVHPRTLRRMELAGEVPGPIGEGRRKRWRAADIDAWLEDERS